MSIKVFMRLFILAALQSYAAFADSTSTGDCKRSVYAKEEQGTVSPLLTDFNIVYAYEKDAPWKEGIVPKKLKAIKTKPLRWPGITVTFYKNYT